MATFYRIKSEIGNSVLESHNYKCVSCGSGNNLCVHHKVKMKPGDPDYNNLDNLTVLCRPCHMSHHRRSGDVVPSIGGIKYGRRGKKDPIKCQIDGCGRWQHGQAYCKMHYERFRRNGTLKTNPAVRL